MKWIVSSRIDNDVVFVAEALAKAKVDIQYHLGELGYKRMFVFRFDDDDESQDARGARIDGITAGVRWGDTLIYQWPTYMGAHMRFDEDFMYHMKARNAKMIALIHDIDSFRFSFYEQWFKDNEFKILGQFDAIITLSDEMSNKLRENGVNVPMVSLESWGYRYAGPLKPKEFKKQLIFAGSIFKSQFLTVYDQKTPINVYGDLTHGNNDGFNFDDVENITFMGPKQPDELLSEFDGGFGLIWDEDPHASEKPQGDFYREYTKMNAPHKMAMYLRAQLPVIAWSQSAAAEKIKRWGVGLVIDSLSQIDEVMENITEDEYKKMQDNAKRLSILLEDGQFLKEATLEAERIALLGDGKSNGKETV